MHFPYIQNFLGVSNLDDEDYENIKHPYGEMYFHVTLKSIQMGTTLGMLLVAPVLTVARKKDRNFSGLYKHMFKSGKIGAAVGVVAGPAMTFFALKAESEDAVWDRAYRLRKNQSQLRCDRAYFAGGSAGLLVSLGMSSNPALALLLGSTTSLVGMGVYNNMLR